MTLTYDGGGGYGIAEITAITSTTVATARVITPMLGITATADWQEGTWSDRMGWPYGVGFHGGRLIWAGDDAIWGSVSDSYDSFDEELVDGDSGPLLRALAVGGRNKAMWVMPMNVLLLGCDLRVLAVRASSLDEVLTPSNFNIKGIDTVPCAQQMPVVLKNNRGLFVTADEAHIYEVSYSNDASDYLATKFSLLTDRLLEAGITSMTVSTFPDQRLWATKNDDDALMMLYEPLLDIVAAIPIATATGDVIESIAVVPGSSQDRIYMSIKRTVNAATVRYVEKLALDSEARPANITKCVDSHVVFGAGSATITGLSHLEGRTVVAWMDGDSVDDADGVAREFTVASGSITLPSVPTIGGCAGLPYRGRYKSARLAYGPEGSSPFNKPKTISHAGFLLSDFCRSGFKFGWAFDDANHPLRSLPELLGGTTATEVVSGVPAIDEQLNPIGSAVGDDPRLCFEVNSPKPATVRSILLRVETLG